MRRDIHGRAGIGKPGHGLDDDMSTGTIEYRYPFSALAADYLKAGAGLVLTAVPLAFAEPGPAAAVMLWALVILFAVLALRTVRRQRTRYTLTADGLGDGGATVAFRDLSDLKLRHFSVPRADRGSGWMELRLSAPGGRIRMESGLDGFQEIARKARDAARDRGIALDEPTRANLRALGLDP